MFLFIKGSRVTDMDRMGPWLWDIKDQTVQRQKILYSDQAK